MNWCACAVWGLLLFTTAFCTTDDIKPYSREHGPRRSHLRRASDLPREVFDGNPIATEPITTSKLLVHYTTETTWVPVRMYIAENPLKSFSVYEPGGIAGSCLGGHRTKTTITSKRKNCLIAGNGGFFNTKNGACLGNLVSDGNIIQNPGTQNANFGITKDNKIITGYLSAEDVQSPNGSTTFNNLIAGVVWLVRNGVNYVNDSALIEDLSTQETGQDFISIISARSALGHDSSGRIILVHVEGKSRLRGLNLWQFADLLVSLGLVNAINLDGGGSMTSVVNNTLANIPSDICPDNIFSCERDVTSIVCIHNAFCSPSCSPHGICNNGECVCDKGWFGLDCSNTSLPRCTSSCNQTGICYNDICVNLNFTSVCSPNENTSTTSTGITTTPTPTPTHTISPTNTTGTNSTESNKQNMMTIIIAIVVAVFVVLGIGVVLYFVRAKLAFPFTKLPSVAGDDTHKKDINKDGEVLLYEVS